MAAEPIYNGGSATATEAEDHSSSPLSRGAAIQALNTIVQLHFEKALEKKHAVAAQKQQLARLHHLFFIFLAIFLLTVSSSSTNRINCRHVWAPITLLTFAVVAHYTATAQTLKAVNGLRYQRRCHKLTLALATDRLKRVRTMIVNGPVDPAHYEIHYQEPPESYLVKFKRSWALHFAFLLVTYGFMVAAAVHLLCF